MKNIVLISTVVATLFIAGCSSKTPEVDTSAETKAPPVVQAPTSVDTTSDADRLSALIDEVQGKVQNVYFDFDKYNIRPDMQDTVKTNSSLLSEPNVSGLKIVIEGNCDEWGSDEYNYALGVRRAKTGKDALVSQGINADRIEIISNGESKPVCTQRSRECDAKNRRDEFKILPNS